MWYPISDNPVVSSTRDGSVRFKFECSNPACKNSIITEPILISEPNNSGENEEGSTVYQKENVECNSCDEEYELEISNGFGGMYCNIEGVAERDIFYEPV